MPVRIKRVYDAPAKDDGERILVDRLWPRGLSKEKAHLDEWMKDIAPSPALFAQAAAPAVTAGPRAGLRARLR